MAVRTYQDLLAWQTAMELVVAIYEATRSFPKEEMYGLTSQLRRAAVSVPSNIAEGQAHGDGRDFARFLRMALGSLQEAETQVILAERLGHLTGDSFRTLLEVAGRTGRLTRGLCQSVASNQQPSTSNP